MKITKDMIEYAYHISKKIYAGEIKREQGKKMIRDDTGMVLNSANDYIAVFLNMIEGREYHRTISCYATRYFLENIRNDFGEDTFKNAVNATDMHTKYYGKLGRGNLNLIEEIVKEFKK